MLGSWGANFQAIGRPPSNFGAEDTQDSGKTVRKSWFDFTENKLTLVRPD
jgi:hypothetical protein